MFMKYNRGRDDQSSLTPLIALIGHSLGAHLAMAFGTLFNRQTDQVTTFNAPGFDMNPNVKQAA